MTQNCRHIGDSCKRKPGAGFGQQRVFEPVAFAGDGDKMGVLQKPIEYRAGGRNIRRAALDGVTFAIGHVRVN